MICLLVFVAIVFVHDASSVDPGTAVNILETHLDTYGLIKKIESALYNYDREFGRAIHFKKNGGCLSANGQYNSDSYSYCVIPSRTCDFSSATQQWRMIDYRLEVASKQHFATISSESHPYKAPCLDCYLGIAECDLVIHGCASGQNQVFMIRIHPTQIDLANKRVHFSIHSQQFQSRCLTDYFNATLGIETFRLSERSGTDEQSFYLDIDLTKEVDEIKAKILDKDHFELMLPLIS